VGTSGITSAMFVIFKPRMKDPFVHTKIIYAVKYFSDIETNYSIFKPKFHLHLDILIGSGDLLLL